MSLLKYIRLAKKLSKPLGKRPKAVINVENGVYVIITYTDAHSRLKLTTNVPSTARVHGDPVHVKQFSKISKKGNEIDLSGTLEAIEILSKEHEHSFDSLYEVLDSTEPSIQKLNRYVPVYAVGMLGSREAVLLDQVGLIDSDNQCYCLTVVNGWLSFTNAHFLVQTKAHSLVIESATIPGKVCGVANELLKWSHIESFISEGKVDNIDCIELTAMHDDYSVTYTSFDEKHLLTPSKVAGLEAEYESDENITEFSGDTLESILARVDDMYRPEVFDRLHKNLSAVEMALGIKQSFYMQLNDNEAWDLCAALYLPRELNKKAKSKFTDEEIKSIRQKVHETNVHLGTYDDYGRDGRYLHDNPIASIDLGYLNVVLSVGGVHNMLLNHHHRVKIDEDDHARMMVLQGSDMRALIMGRLN